MGKYKIFEQYVLAGTTCPSCGRKTHHIYILNDGSDEKARSMVSDGFGMCSQCLFNTLVENDVLVIVKDWDSYE